MTRFLLFSFCILGSCFAVGCGSGDSGDPVISVEDTDEKMNAAMKTAKETIPQFLKHWKTLPSDTVSVKIGIPTPDDGVEHIWFEPISITDTQVTGFCGNEPNKIADLKIGDKRTFDRSVISDWMILVGNKCYGGYTIRVLSEMDPENAPDFTYVEFEDTP